MRLVAQEAISYCNLPETVKILSASLMEAIRYQNAAPWPQGCLATEQKCSVLTLCAEKSAADKPIAHNYVILPREFLRRASPENHIAVKAIHHRLAMRIMRNPSVFGHPDFKRLWSDASKNRAFQPRRCSSFPEQTLGVQCLLWLTVFFVSSAAQSPQSDTVFL